MADENKFKKPLRKLPAEDIEYKQEPYNIREGNTFKKEYEKKELKVRDISNKKIKRYLENKEDSKIMKKTAKNLSELEGAKPGIDKPTGKIQAFNKSKGGQIKPIKAVLGVAVLGTKKGRDTLKKYFKGKKEVLSSAPGMAAVPKTMNKGGGMDMGHKPRPRGNPGIVENVVGKGGDYIKDLID